MENLGFSRFPHVVTPITIDKKTTQQMGIEQNDQNESNLKFWTKGLELYLETKLEILMLLKN